MATKGASMRTAIAVGSIVCGAAAVSVLVLAVHIVSGRQEATLQFAGVWYAWTLVARD